jgi:FMN phosphatase YigB (HAD superfamily)
MELFPHVPDVLRGIHDRGARALVVTNGNPRQQRNKVAAIDWRGHDASLEFHYAAETAPKPDPAVFSRNILPRHGLDRSAYLFVGDAASDRAFAHNCGVAFMWADRFHDIFRPMAGRQSGK